MGDMEGLLDELKAEAAARDPLVEYRDRAERALDDACVAYLTRLLPHLDTGPPAVTSREYGWLEGAAMVLVELGVASTGESLLYVGHHALRRPGVAQRLLSGGDDLPGVRLATQLLERWPAFDWLGTNDVISSSEAAGLLGLANADAATRTLRRWGVATAPRQAGQGRESRYYRADVVSARDRAPGRGARTDLTRGLATD